MIGMWFCFIGFLFIFLDFEITLAGGTTVNFIPDFLGYALLSLGVFHLGHENGRFSRCRITALVALVLSAGTFVLDLLALPLPPTAELIIGILMTVVSLYITYEFSEGTKALERSLYKKLDADKISAAWVILSMTSLLEFLVLYFPAVFIPCYALHWLAVAWFESSVFHFSRKLSGKER